MTTVNTPSISKEQVDFYNENGFLIVRNVLSTDEAGELRSIVQQEVQRDAYPSSLKYPEPSKYTVSGNRMADAGMASIVEHPTVVDAVEGLLGQPAHLTAFVAYLRTPGDKGLWRAL